MPELPEVETITRDLNKKIKDLSIDDVMIFDDRVVVGKKKDFIKNLKNKKIHSITRRAKAIIVSFADQTFLVIHLKMTGQLVYGKNLKESENLKETKVVFKLSDGKFLNYNDQRLFGKLTFAADLDDISYLKNLGPEPLNGHFSAEWLNTNLEKRKVPIKTLLMDQRFVAGIGNIYASEILFAAKVHPQKLSSRLKSAQIELLYQSTRNILNEAIQYRGTSMRNYRDADGKKGEFNNRIKVYAKDNEPCSVCGELILKIVQAGRSTFFCQKYQK